MKTCKHCGSEIINGVNGASCLDNCLSCNPDPYPCKPSKLQDNNDYESQINYDLDY